ncbi:MAG: dienelactone hydrolase family protein [Candidatus Methanoperedens sp.]|nr:dienelactone hydrolase family protein [Candidatus Methanoperedens sp.]MCZ7369351.1 dienelactone hydrolase family protein [Candidatus Methanoperedens sp.]
MKILMLGLLMAALVISGCTQKADRGSTESQIQSATVDIVSGNLTYPAYLAAPTAEGKKPAVVLIHSFNGLEPGYRSLTDNFASEGYVVISPEWQTFNKTPADEVLGGLIKDSVAYLRTRNDVDTNRLGLTGFCAGGRYTMLFLPQMPEFKSGVAWYGFPYSGGFANQSKPADYIDQLKAPMLMIHGTHDMASPIADIYSYATALNASGKYFELKVYQGQPHGFMIENGQLSQSFEARDAYREMVTFFNRTLGE